MNSDAQERTDRSKKQVLNPKGLLEAALWLQLLAAPGPLLARWAFVFELMSYARLQLAAGLGLGALLAWALHRRGLALASTVAALVLAQPLAAPMFHVEPAAAPGPTLRLLQANVKTEARGYAQLAALIDAEAPDVVALEEVDAAWLEALGPQRQRYPHRLEHPRDDNFGIALWSRHPLGETRVVEAGRGATPTLDALLRIEGYTLRVVVTHPSPPFRAQAAARRDEQLLALAAMLRQGARPAVLVGDLNATPNAPIFRDVVEFAGLQDVPAQRWPLGTWPAFLPFGAIWIDHVLPTEGVRVEALATATSIGSDHRPVLARLRLVDAR